ncbi:sodium/hydrogen antiporter [Microdochium nivale]|nr:sodium/hydrogen antiporter [Microdochium nivale]
MLLNVSIFMWYGAVCPWEKFLANDVVPLYRLVPLGILILLLRRPPVILGAHRWIPQTEEIRQALFMGFFGPVGVSGIFYLYVTLEFIEGLNHGGTAREDVAHLGEATTVVVWFVAICSVVVHGLSVPLGKLGFWFPRTLSRTLTQENDQHNARARLRDRVSNAFPILSPARSTSRNNSPRGSAANSGLPIHRIGGSVIHDGVGAAVATRAQTRRPETPPLPSRTIRFPDDSTE